MGQFASLLAKPHDAAVYALSSTTATTSTSAASPCTPTLSNATATAAAAIRSEPRTTETDRDQYAPASECKPREPREPHVYAE